MDIKKAIVLLEKNIETLEKETYNFENVAIPRYHSDKEILRKMREQFRKLEVYQDMLAQGKEVTKEEYDDLVPESFR